MDNKKSDTEKVLIEKEKALKSVRSLINNKNANLNTKYLKSHDKVAIIYKDHVIELNGGEEKYLKYMAINIPLSTKEYKEIFRLFIDEVKKREEDASLKKLNELTDLMEN